MNRLSLISAACLLVVTGCQSLPEQPAAQSSATQPPPAAVSALGGCTSCGYEVTISPPADQPVLPTTAAAAGDDSTPSNTITQVEHLTPIPETSIPTTVDEQTAKRVASLLTRLVSPTEERQAWLGDSPYLEDLNATLAGAATNSESTSNVAQAASAPVITQVQHVSPEPLETTATSAQPSDSISRAEYLKLMQTLSALQSKLQEQQSGNAAIESPPAAENR